MRVILVNPVVDDGRDLSQSLTMGREYEVLGLEADAFRLLNDKDEPVLYDPRCFTVTDESEPSFWISTTGDQGDRYAYPRQWSRPGYFEDWHDGKATVVDGFWSDLARFYPWTNLRRQTS